MKKLRLFIAALLVCLFGCMFTVNAEAASYQKVTSEKQKTGKYYVWLDDSGAVMVSSTKSGAGSRVVSRYVSAISNGNYIYWGKYSGDAMEIFRYKISTGVIKSIATIKHADGVVGYYNGKLYIDRHQTEKYGCDYTSIHTCSYSLKTGKLRRVMKGISCGASYGKYLIGMPNSGAVMDLPLKVYNAKTGKTKTISSKALNYTRIGNYVYYVDTTKAVNGGWSARVYRYSLTSGKKKALGKSFKTSAVFEITKNYARYYTISGKRKKISY